MSNKSTITYSKLEITVSTDIPVPTGILGYDLQEIIYDYLYDKSFKSINYVDVSMRYSNCIIYTLVIELGDDDFKTPPHELAESYTQAI